MLNSLSLATCFSGALIKTIAAEANIRI